MGRVRLSSRQREVLDVIEFNCRPVNVGRVESDSRVIPVYMGHLGNMFQHCFWYERELRRFLENLESRGLITIEKREFIYITDEGRRALGLSLLTSPTTGADGESP